MAVGERRKKSLKTIEKEEIRSKKVFVRKIEKSEIFEGKSIKSK